ncbi:cation-translocating P-type ATPase [Effusibacillus dendaii]|uniref:P-type Ca(2+) transporter n=1 Tax=Effusibacillus dendaii TaxID=2743772 RepID=A0A7I8DE41_9BACL|nr:HAD-IC family P-type ATPase [Effusibacillus dendaii]BCJ88375.1 calcium-transporting P-type ATPase, PMR1-type [Effusibacillus dendaii]
MFGRAIPGRIRIQVHSLKHNHFLKREWERKLLQLAGVMGVEANPITGRVLILFDESAVTADQIGEWVEEIEEIYAMAEESGELTKAAAEAASTAEAWLEAGEYQEWHARPIEAAIELLRTNENGLPSSEINQRLARHGPNALQEAPRPGWWRLFFRQFANFMTIALMASAFATLLLGRVMDAASIFAVLLLNASLGTFQERKAEDEAQALRKLTAPTAKVLRDGQEVEVPANTLVPGDVIVVDPGDQIPADARLIDCWNLEVDESSLTGESVPVRKKSGLCNNDTALADRTNMLFMGSHVTRGRARSVVVATGMETELGRLFALIQKQPEESTPLQKKLNVLGQYLVYVSLGISLFVMLIGLLRGNPFADMLMTAISLATSAIPEGLPIMITIALAVGMRRMVGKNALVRKLSALETLGRATVICTDKTGTLTKNEMTVRAVSTAVKTWDVSGNGFAPIGQFTENEQLTDVKKEADLEWLLRAATLCSDAKLLHNGTEEWEAALAQGGLSSFDEGWTIQGDPTEGSILVAAAKAGILPESCRKPWERLKETPFESERRRMSVVCRDSGNQCKLIVKGAIEDLLMLCDRVQVDGQLETLTESHKNLIMEKNDQFASRALRVLAVAYRPLPDDYDPVGEEGEMDEQNLIFLGIIGMIDPPRDQVKESIAHCQKAGIKVVMITGDHPQTAAAIARELNLLSDGGRVLTGPELDQLTDDELVELVPSVDVYARVSPHHKLRIVASFKKRGEIVVMTGDGVNDSPAVKQADVGIAMGRAGVDVTKQASSMIITDDNFVTICKGVQEGRSILGNIRKSLGYLLSGNLGEVIYATLAVLIGMPLPLVPIQILLINLFTDALPSIALAMGNSIGDQNALSLRSARDVTDRNLITQIVARGVVIGLTTMAVFSGTLALTGNLMLARTMAFMTVCASELIQAVDWWRNDEADKKHSSLLLQDRFMTGTLAVSWAGLLSIVYLPPLQGVFQTVALSPLHWLIILAIGGSISMLTRPVARLVAITGQKLQVLIQASAANRISGRFQQPQTAA